ncbi:uncharacterized protein LOC135376952 [Ornithodoros turicata]|uniref:uncharacterized protein LOC135376952 n=1 Tax=Ornithodoros turicata TaxID=34597 RepID=UPI0031389E76
MSSSGAASTAKPSRAESSSLQANTSQGTYKIIMPTLPKGDISRNTVFLHADPSARPYKVQDFVEPLRRVVNNKDIAGFGSYLFNHVWIITMHSDEEKEKLRKAGELTVKGRRCIVVDPNSNVISLKLHWLPTNVPDEVVRRALSLYGTAKEVVREKWKLPGLEGVETTTRSVVLHLKEGCTTESIPYQLKIMGATVLVSVPGKAPLCLRCKQVGHIRSQCRTEYCRTCKGFGHIAEDCVRTYAAMTRGAVEKPNADMVMDVQDTEANMQDNEEPVQKAGTSDSGETENEVVETAQETDKERQGKEPQRMDWSREEDPLGKRKGTDTEEKVGDARQDQSGKWQTPLNKKSRQGHQSMTQLPLEEAGSSQLDDPGFF